jgi:hypothetical protein
MLSTNVVPSGAATGKPRAVQASDVLAGLFLLAVAGFAAFATLQRVEEYWWAKAALAAFNEHVKGPEPPPAVDRAAWARLAAEAAGCVLALGLTVLLLVRRRRPVTVIREQQPKIPAPQLELIDLGAFAKRLEPPQPAISLGAAADRAGFVVWGDRLAEPESALRRA